MGLNGKIFHGQALKGQACILTKQDHISTIYYLDKIESLNFAMRVLGNYNAMYFM